MQNESITKTKQVLIIEDDKIWIACINNMVGSLGMEPINLEPVKSAKEALSLIEQYHQESDFILLDMNLGHGTFNDSRADGYKIAAHLHIRHPKGSEILAKTICNSGLADNYVELLRPLGIRHFGGKSNFSACLMGRCNCETAD